MSSSTSGRAAANPAATRIVVGYDSDVKAVSCEGPGDEDVLRLVDRPAPVLRPDSVRIAVTAAGVNRADLLQRRGLYPPPPGEPETLGLECAGRIIELSSEVTGFANGDRVMALVAGGGQAGEAVVDAGSLLRVPDDFSDVHAGAFPEVFLTAHLNLFVLGGMRRGTTVLAHGGSGGVGTAAILLAKACGARILVTAGSAERCRRCLDLGADLAVNYREEDFVERCLEATDGAGVDIVLDCIGGGYLGRNLEALGPDGRLVVIGLMGGTTGELDLRRLLSNRIRVIGSTLRALDADRKAKIVASFVARFGGDLEQGRLRPVIDRVFPLEHVVEAHRRLASGEAFGKVVLALDS
jgi:putative PIG3 family NAD(P)H quinone oxidoreductase